MDSRRAHRKLHNALCSEIQRECFVAHMGTQMQSSHLKTCKLTLVLPGVGNLNETQFHYILCFAHIAYDHRRGLPERLRGKRNRVYCLSVSSRMSEVQIYTTHQLNQFSRAMPLHSIAGSITIYFYNGILFECTTI